MILSLDASFAGPPARLDDGVGRQASNGRSQRTKHEKTSHNARCSGRSLQLLSAAFHAYQTTNHGCLFILLIVIIAVVVFIGPVAVAVAVAVVAAAGYC